MQTRAMRLSVAYSFLVASVVFCSSTRQTRPTVVSNVNRYDVLDQYGIKRGHTRKLTKPASSGGVAIPGPKVPGPEVPGPEVPGPEVPGPEVPEPVASTQNTQVEKMDGSTTAYVPTATPYALPVDSTPEVRNDVNTTPSPRSDVLYFKPPDIMSLFVPTTAPKTTGEGADATTPKEVAITTILSLPAVVKVDEMKVVTEKEPTQEPVPVSHNPDEFDRKGGGKDHKTTTESMFYAVTSALDTKKSGKKKTEAKALVPEGNTQPKGGVAAMEAKRVYDNVLKAYDSVKKGFCFSPAELQKAFPKCKIMY